MLEEFEDYVELRMLSKKGHDALVNKRLPCNAIITLLGKVRKINVLIPFIRGLKAFS